MATRWGAWKMSSMFLPLGEIRAQTEANSIVYVLLLYLTYYYSGWLRRLLLEILVQQGLLRCSCHMNFGSWLLTL